MKKMITALALAAIGAFALTGCGGSPGGNPAGGNSTTGGNTSSPPPAEKSVTLKIGFQANSSSNEYKAAELLAEKAK